MTKRRSQTPQPTPGPRPGTQPPPSSRRSAQAKPLRDSIRLTGPGWDLTLHPGEVLIGRDPTCRVIVDDPLVSREHALLRVRPEEVRVEDLRSANGVYVNNVRIYRPARLYDGDRLLLGTTELCVFVAEPERLQRGPHTVSAAVVGRPPPAAAAPTERVAALDVLGRLADRMLAAERPQHAERVLADHLAKLLDGARSGLPVPESVANGAARQALKLARALGEGKWINFAIELHLRGEICMARETVSELAAAIEGASGIDHALYGYYVEWLRDVAPRLGPDALWVVDTLDGIKLPSR